MSGIKAFGRRPHEVPTLLLPGNARHIFLHAKLMLSTEQAEQGCHHVGGHKGTQECTDKQMSEAEEEHISVGTLSPNPVNHPEETESDL